jgi:ABC-2 type transport system permease protein
MKILYTFIQKEFRHVLRDRRSLFILLGMPVVMMLIFGFALSNEVKNSAIAIVDPSKDEATLALIDRLEHSRYFQVTHSLSHSGEIEDLFQRGEVRMVVLFPEQFEFSLQHGHEARIQLIGDATDPNVAGTVIQYASGIIRDYQDELMAERKLPYRIGVETRMLYNPQLESSFNFVPGVMTLILTLLGVMMTSVSIVREKEMGTMEVLLVSPMRPILVVISKMIPYLVLCFVDVLIILFLSYTALGLPLRGNMALLLAECLLFIMTALSLGLLISTIVDSQMLAMFISLVGFMLPAIVFSGFMFPIENMPIPLQLISNIVPTKWFYSIVSNIMVKGLGMNFIFWETIILGGMTLFFLVVALRKFKVRLE